MVKTHTCIQQPLWVEFDGVKRIHRSGFGAVFGAWIGAVLLGNDWSFTAILSLLLIPATAAAVAIFVKSLVAHTDAT